MPERPTLFGFLQLLAAAFAVAAVASLSGNHYAQAAIALAVAAVLYVTGGQVAHHNRRRAAVALGALSLVLVALFLWAVREPVPEILYNGQRLEGQKITPIRPPQGFRQLEQIYFSTDSTRPQSPNVRTDYLGITGLAVHNGSDRALPFGTFALSFSTPVEQWMTNSSTWVRPAKDEDGWIMTLASQVSRLDAQTVLPIVELQSVMPALPMDVKATYTYGDKSVSARFHIIAPSR